MDHSGRAFKLALSRILWGLVAVLALLSAGVVAIFLGHLIATISWGLIGLWIASALLILFLHRDPHPIAPLGLPKAVVAPSHGRITEITQTSEPGLMPGDCQRISIHLGWREVHVGKSPVDGVITSCLELSAAPGPSSRATGSHWQIAIAPREAPRETIALRYIAGRYPRKCLSWSRTGDIVERSQSLGMMQFGSRCELFLPLSAEVQVRPGDPIRGGETIVACFA